MRSKTFVLGSILFSVLLTLMSARTINTTPDVGYNPGETLPSIKVDDIELQSLMNNPNIIVVLWSKSDAKSRMVNSWLSWHKNESQMLSICVDASTSDAKTLASIDGVSSTIDIIGIADDQSIIKSWGLSRGLKTFTIEDGIISTSNMNEDIWHDVISSKH